MSDQMAFAVQWSLNETSATTLTVARGLVKAATSDDVQPLALRACEQFGTTLPMTAEIRLKMETIARKRHSTMLDFIKCQVGYSEGDSADYLSRTDGGVRFLGFAATLYSIKSSISAAQILEEMVRETAKDKQLLPTILQYKNLIDALESKLALSGFANSVQGWATVCSSIGAGLKPRLPSYAAPDRTKIKDLVQALNQCFRVGEECTILIESAFIYFPWTIAFVKWFSGTPPMVWTTEKILLDIPESSVNIRETHKEGQVSAVHFDISLTRKLDSLKTLINHEANAGYLNLGGLVDVDVWLRNRIASYQRRITAGLPLIALLQQTLWVIISTFPDKLLLTTDLRIVDKLSKSDLPEPNSYRAYPFPVSAIRLQIAQYLLHDSLILQQDNFNYAHWMDEIQSTCSNCYRCNPHVKSKQGNQAPCFKDFAADIAADLLVLSLVMSDGHSSHRPRVQLKGTDLQVEAYHRLRYGTDRLSSMKETFSSTYTVQSEDACCTDHLDWTGVVQRGWWSLATGVGENAPILYKAEGLFHHLLHLLGHQTTTHDDNIYSIIVSQGYGQVVFPAIVETHVPVRVGYASYRLLQGTLRRSGANISQIFTQKEPWSQYDYRASSAPLGVSYVPERVFYSKPTYEIWETTDQRMDTLRMSTSIRQDIALWSLIDGLATTIFSPECGHSPAAQAGKLGRLYHLASIKEETGLPPLCNLPPNNNTSKCLVPLHGCGTAQLWQIAMVKQSEDTAGSAVLHWKGCIACALKLCEDIGWNMVIC
ncbi:MAG: hypothetical protein Q9187_008358 [Circinaria calcarea]